MPLRKARLLGPFLTALYATPRVAMVPLIIIWFGIGMWSKVFIVFLSAFFPILVNTVAGIRNMDRDREPESTSIVSGSDRGDSCG